MKVLVIQQRSGIGDMVILLPYIHSISKKFNTPVSILAKESSKAADLFAEDDHIDEVITLDKEKDGLKGIFNLSKTLKKKKFDKVFILNSSMRYSLVARLSNIKSIYQYPLSLIKKDNMVNTAKVFTEGLIDKEISTEPRLKVQESKENFDKNFKHICLGVSASGPTKRWDIRNYIKLSKELTKICKCKFYVAVGPNDLELIKEFENSDLNFVFESFENLSIKQTLNKIKHCDCYIGNDTGFAHISVALKVKSLVLFVDTPIKVYGKYAPSLMSTVEPVGEKDSTVHNTSGKDSISFDEVLNKSKKILNLN